jgi:hypothetical protein
LAVLLCGCQYTAYVRNATDRPVQVQMVRHDLLNPDWILDTALINPGERVRLGPARIGGGKAVLEAGERTKTGGPARLRLWSGDTSVVLGYEPDGRTLSFNRAGEP